MRIHRTLAGSEVGSRAGVPGPIYIYRCRDYSCSGLSLSLADNKEHLARVKVLAAIASSTNRSRRQRAEIFIAVEQDECGCLEPPYRVQLGGLNLQRTQALDQAFATKVQRSGTLLVAFDVSAC